MKSLPEFPKKIANSENMLLFPLRSSCLCAFAVSFIGLSADSDQREAGVEIVLQIDDGFEPDRDTQ